MKNINSLPIIGERLVVHGMSQAAHVENVVWDSESNAWKILLDWGPYGKSRVWAHDENRVWFRKSINN